MSTEPVKPKLLLEKKSESLTNMQPEEADAKLLKKLEFDQASANIISEHSSDSHSVYEKELVVSKNITNIRWS
jgi:hypothetical protein